MLSRSFLIILERKLLRAGADYLPPSRRAPYGRSEIFRLWRNVKSFAFSERLREKFAEENFIFIDILLS